MTGKKSPPIGLTPEQLVDLRKDNRLTRSIRREKAERKAWAGWDHAVPVASLSYQSECGPEIKKVSHFFLEVNEVPPGSLRIDDQGHLLVPGMDIDGNFQTMQSISPRAEIKMATGCNANGAMFLIDSRDELTRYNPSTGLRSFLEEPATDKNIYSSLYIILAEDYETGALLHKASGLPVAITFKSDNFQPVAESLAQKYSQAQIIICANDYPTVDDALMRQRAGLAAKAVGGRLVLPRVEGLERISQPLSFVEINRRFGLEGVKQVLLPSLSIEMRNLLDQVVER